MAINIGVTGSAGRFIGGGAGVYQNTQLKLYLDPFDYSMYTGETSAYIFDKSGWGNDIVLVNGARTRSDGHWSFDGTDDFGYRTDDPDFDYSTSTDFSIQLWYNNLGGDKYDFYLLSKGRYNAPSRGELQTGWSLFYDESSQEMVMRHGTLNSVDSPLTDGDWVSSGWKNIAVVSDRSSNVKFYLNGVLVTTYAFATTSYDTSSDRYLLVGGAQSSNSTSAVVDELNGYMGHILVYSTLLDEDEIRQNFNAHRGIYGV